MAIIDNIVSYYKMDSVTTLDDEEDTNEGTVSGCTSVTGKISNAFNFDGTNDYCNISSPSSLNFGTGNFTINFWIKTSASNTDPQYRTIYMHDDAWLNVGGWAICLNQGKVCIRDSGAINDVSTSTVNSGSWVMVTIVRTGTGTNETICYINGSSDKTNTNSYNMSRNPTESWVGRRDGGNYWAFILDELGFWDVALTSSEVTDLYNSGSGLAYPFSSGTNTQINIGDAWKTIAGVQINIGDTWKTVEGMQVNIGDTWKTIF